MKGWWQQEEGSQALSDVTASQRKTSLVSMAANETFLCILIRDDEDVKMQRRDGDIVGGRDGARLNMEERSF